MSYDPNLPNPNDLLSNSQGQIKQNFQQLDVVYGLNHYEYSNATSNKGKHKFVDMPVLGAAPAIAAGDGGLYTKAATGSQLFYTADNNGQEYQLTRCITASFAKFATNTALPSANGNGGFSYLPGGLLIQYGIFTAASSSGVTVQFPIPFTGVPFSVQITPVANDNSTLRLSISTGTVTNSQFKTEQTSSSHLTNAYFIAIGI